jgi:photosystem II stability/assembly factor-like uncharacterized protein
MEFLPLKTVISAFQASLSSVPDASCGFAVADLKVELPAEVAVIGGEVLVKLPSSSEPIDPAVLTKLSFTLGATCTPEAAPAPVSPWTAVPSGTAESLYGAWSQAGSAWIVGKGGTVLSSNNGATSFSSVDVGTTARFFTVSKIADVMVVAGEFGNAWFREPGAAVWHQSGVPSTGHINSLAPYGALLVAVGSAGSMFLSVNHGQTFDMLMAVTQNNLHSVVAGPDGLLWAAGAQGTVLVATDVKSWKLLPKLVAQHWYALSPMQSGRVFAAGESGQMAIYTPGGGQTVSSGTTKHLYAVHVMESGAVLAVGADGAAVWSKDGASFTALAPPTTQSLHAIADLGGGKLLVAGADGVVLRLDTTLL